MRLILDASGRIRHSVHLGKAEVEHLHGAVVLDLDVAGLEVAMDDAGVVRGVER